MEREFLPCEKCGRKTKRIFLVRRPLNLGIAAVGVVLFLGSKALGTSEPVALIGLLVFAIAFGSLLRIRCLDCEPQWKEQIWGKPT
jgi:hypothetical protein